MPGFCASLYFLAQKEIVDNERKTMDSDSHETQKYPWAGPALFVSVLLALLVFFTWFLGGK